MCDRCDEIDRKISHYRRLLGNVADSQFIKGITGLLTELELERTKLQAVCGSPQPT
jgi:hypothetical protein